MTAVFADTFYWIALADFSDKFHERALTLTAVHAAQPLVTTDEVLTEYLNYFGGQPETLRRHVAASVRRMMGLRRSTSLLRAGSRSWLV